jgi:hypothetical protein
MRKEADFSRSKHSGSPILPPTIHVIDFASVLEDMKCDTQKQKEKKKKRRTRELNVLND